MGLFTRKHKTEEPPTPAPVSAPVQTTTKTVLIEVPGRQVTSGDTSIVEHVIRESFSSPDLVIGSQGHVGFLFKDFEHAEYVFLVPEVRRFVRTLHQHVKHLFYFLSTDAELAQFLEFAVAFSPDDAIFTEGGRVQVRLTDQLTNAFAERVLATAAFAAQVGADAEQVVRSVTGQLVSGDMQEALVAQALAGVQAGPPS